MKLNILFQYIHLLVTNDEIDQNHYVSNTSEFNIFIEDSPS